MNLYAVIDSFPYGEYVYIVRAETIKRAIEIAKVEKDSRHTIKTILLSTKGKEKLIVMGGSAE